MSTDREQLERMRWRAERERERERERRRREAIVRPEPSHEPAPGHEPRRRPTGPRAEPPAREPTRRDRERRERDGGGGGGYAPASVREPSRRDRESDRERERDSGGAPVRRQSTRGDRDRDPDRAGDPARRHSRRESRSNPPAAPVAVAAVAGGSSGNGSGSNSRRQSSTRDPERRHSRRSRTQSDERRGPAADSVRLVARDVEEINATEAAAAAGLTRGGTRRERRSHSTRERSSGGGAEVDRTRSGRNAPGRERSRRERATAPAGWVDPDMYDRRQEEMRARYMPVPQVLAPAAAVMAGGWDGSGDGSADLEKGSGGGAVGGDAAALLADKRMSTGSGVGLLHKEKRSRGGSGGGGSNSGRGEQWCHPCFWILGIVALILLIILIPVGILVIGKDKSKINNSSSDGSKGEKQSGLKGIDRASIPPEARGTYYDPFDWLDTTDFNCTYTNETVGGLPIMGLFTNYDDSVQPNSNVPPLNKPFSYGKQPMRGVNVGGWLVMEPFITPSYFKQWDSRFGVVDEYTLATQLGPDQTRKTFENHYSTFIIEEDFKMMRDAGLDHVRIPYGYWAVMKLPGDPYLFQVQWRYLLRAIEWCRKYGLRVNLDLHSAPGGANGWNHSGRLGPIQWLNGTDGDKNAQLTLDLHNQLSIFFSQPRYKNIVTLYGLVNEPRMTFLEADKVIKWTSDAYATVRKNGYTGKIVFGDGFRGLEKWKGEFSGLEGMLLDVHQYVIFNTGQIAQTHTGKVQFACRGWAAQLKESMDTRTGFGPTMVGEWGQADTDCTLYVNNVGVGTRWEGTLKYSNNDPSNVLTPSCPNKYQCSCTKANEAPKNYSDEYRLFLKTFAIAQMDAFENGWGWMYWTWQTEDAHQWSYKKGLDAGILPKNVVKREWSCAESVPDFAAAGLPESY